MKNLMIKSFTLIMSALMILSVLSAMTGCAGNEDEIKQEDSSSSPQVTETEQLYLDSLGNNIDLAKREIRFLIRTEEPARNELTETDVVGEPTNDAVHDRNICVEDRLNCLIVNKKQIVGGDDNAAAQIIEQESRISNSNEYDIYVSNSYNSVESAYKGYLTNLKSCESIDLSKPYWSQGLNAEISMGNKQYLCTGTFSMAFYRYMFVTLFNKQMFDDSSTAYPYEKVINNEWTLDEQISLARQFYKNLDSDPSPSEDDRYGYVNSVGSSSCMTDGFWTACGLCTTVKDENNYYEYSVDKARFEEAINKINDLIYSSGSYVYVNDDQKMSEKFTNGQAAMIPIRLMNVENVRFRDMGTYGILPMAKLNATQKNYRTHVQDQFLVYAIPATVPDTDLQDVGLFLEAFASQSYITVRPAYYEIALTAKYVNDEDSVKMLDIAGNSVNIDATSIYIRILPLNTTTMRQYIADRDTNIISKLGNNEKKIRKAIDLLNDKYKKIKQ